MAGHRLRRVSCLRDSDGTTLYTGSETADSEAKRKYNIARFHNKNIILVLLAHLT